MNTVALLRIGALSLLAAHTARAEDIPESMPLPVPTYGFNLGNTLESTWGYPAPTQAIFTNAANAGFNAVRVPCAWDFRSDGNGNIDPAFLAEVKQVVDWAIAEGMYVLINDHWDGGWFENNIGDTVDPVIDAQFASYWTQIATAFADYDNHLLFAAANEPNADTPAKMKTLYHYYQTFVDAVRGVGGKNATRWLVLQGGELAWLPGLPVDSTPNRLMMEYHNYTPSLFTIFHTDQSWGKAIYYWGSAYFNPADPTRNATWGLENDIDAGFQHLRELFVDRGIPVLIGEFQAAPTPGLTGAARDYNDASRLYWNKYLVDSAHAHGLSPFYWSTPNSPFKYDTGEILDAAIVQVLTGGAAPPPPNGAPYAVTGFTATLVDDGIALSWDTVEGATSYSLYRAAESGNESAIAPYATAITSTSYLDTALNDGTTYYYQVVAVNDSGESGFSQEVHATTPGDNPDPAQYHFETDAHRFASSGSQITGIATSTDRAFAGQSALAVSFGGSSSGTSSITLNDVNVPAGTTITFNVWIPSGSKVTRLQPYLQDYNWATTNASYSTFVSEDWNTITLTVPPTAAIPLKRLGLNLTTNAAWTGVCYVDSIAWDVVKPPTTPAGLAAVADAEAVSLTWSAAPDAATYRVMRSKSSESGYETIATVESPAYTNSGLPARETFHYVVIAANDAGESRATDAVSATTKISIEDWRLEHFNTTENTGDAADSFDPDHDGATNWEEYVSGTDPNDPKSFLRIHLPEMAGGEVVIRFPSVSDKTYRLERSISLLPDSWTTVQDGISGTGETIQVTDSNIASAERVFYRLVVNF